MNRKRFLYGSLCATAASLAVRPLRALVAFCEPIRLAIRGERTLGTIPASFTGLGYEISSVARPGLLSAANHAYVSLVRTLGPNGIIRIGGNTSDYSAYSANAAPFSAPKSTVINQSNLRDLGTFLDATGWRLIWGLNLGTTNLQAAVEEARAVTAHCGHRLLAFEIGNEPDLFTSEGHRAVEFGYAAWLADYRRYKSGLRAALPAIQFAGPDVAGHTGWVESFALDEGRDLRLLTHHYYREGQNPGSTLEKLFRPDPKLAPLLRRLAAASANAHIPYRICEVNSFSGGGRPGVSDTFGAALWVLDYMFTLACGSCGGVNMETGVNQLNFISSYSPIGDDEHGTYTAAPEYYGMLAFAHGTGGTHGNEAQRLAVDYDPASINFTAYATQVRPQTIKLTVINKDAAQSATLLLTTTRPIRGASVVRMLAPSLTSKQGITLGGTAVDADGQWKPQSFETISVSKGRCTFQLPAASAAIVTLDV